jgi:hypothetical protein
MFKYELYIWGGNKPVITFADDIKQAITKVTKALQGKEVTKVIICKDNTIGKKSLRRGNIKC